MPASSPTSPRHTVAAPTDAAAEPAPSAPRGAPLPTRGDRDAAPTVTRAPHFDDPATLAAQLLAAERTIRSDDPAPGDLEAAAWTQQQAYRDLVANPEWRPSARGRIPAELRDRFDRNLRATAELRALTRPRDELPDWRIVTPPPPGELRSHYEAAAGEFGVAWEYLAAIHLVETRMGRIRGASVAGARGPMQFLPSTWEAYGEGDINDPRDAIRAAARYLVAHGAPDDMDGALFAYNRSDRYVTAISDHAAVMREDPRTYRSYYHWRVYYRMPDGDRILHEGYGD